MTKIAIFETDLQNRIANHLSQGRAPVDIAKICECSVDSVYDVQKSAKYAQLCYNSAMQELFTTGAKAAVSALISVATDPDAPKSARVSASDKILQHTGCHVTESGRLEKSLSTMTQEELQNRLRALQNEAASRAKPAIIEAEPITNILD